MSEELTKRKALCYDKLIAYLQKEASLNVPDYEAINALIINIMSGYEDKPKVTPVPDYDNPMYPMTTPCPVTCKTNA